MSHRSSVSSAWVTRGYFAVEHLDEAVFLDLVEVVFFDDDFAEHRVVFVGHEAADEDGPVRHSLLCSLEDLGQLFQAVEDRLDAARVRPPGERTAFQAEGPEVVERLVEAVEEHPVVHSLDFLPVLVLVLSADRDLFFEAVEDLHGDDDALHDARSAEEAVGFIVAFVEDRELLPGTQAVRGVEPEDDFALDLEVARWVKGGYL